VRDAVGVDEARGDTLSVVNISFQQSDDEDIGLPLWQQPWFWEMVKQLAGGLAVLLIIFGVLRPLLRDLTGVKERVKDDDIPDEDEEEAVQVADQLSEGETEISEALEALDAQGQDELTAMIKEDEDLIEKLKAKIEAEPKIAARILREWMMDKGK
jgi:flagellar M-ring protein FliF